MTTNGNDVDTDYVGGDYGGGYGDKILTLVMSF